MRGRWIEDREREREGGEKEKSRWVRERGDRE